MPMGRVTRVSGDTAYIETSTSNYRARQEDMAADTQFEGAHVLFDVERDDPVDRAVNVTLREGTRHDKKQRRFGDTG